MHFVFCDGLVLEKIIVRFTYILQGYFTGTYAVIWSSKVTMNDIS